MTENGTGGFGPRCLFFPTPGTSNTITRSPLYCIG